MSARPRIIPSIETPVGPGEGFVGRGPRWSVDELRVLRERYPTGGALACLPFLPARHENTIRAKANKLGIRHHAQYARQAPSDDLLDAAIRKLYAKGKPAPGAMAKLCARYNRPRQWVRSRAIKLGAITHIRGRNWTADEDAILRELAGFGPRKMQKALVKAGFTDRTEPAIAERCRRVHAISNRVERDPDLYSANDVAGLLGEDDHRILGWLNRGALRGRAERDPVTGRVTRWNVTRKDLREWMIRHPQEWLPARCDRYWLVEILAGRVGRAD
jgi:hypothetical protein